MRSDRTGPTGISVDAAGKIWAGCYDASTAVRIDPEAGPLVVRQEVVNSVTNSVTNHVGLVDMVVDLGDGSWHPAPYNGVTAHPYNYSDMTGLNVRVVNDSGNAGQLWNKLSWTADAAETNGCSVEVYVRASEERTGQRSHIIKDAQPNRLRCPVGAGQPQFSLVQHSAG